MIAWVEGLPVHYQERGSGTPILMLHGRAADHRQMMADLEPVFAERSGWRRLYPDLPGMGRTPGADWITHQDHMLAVVTGFVEAVAPGQRLVVAGTSYGAYLALGVVHRLGAAVDGLALIVPAVERDRARRSLPPRQVLVEDAAFLGSLAPDESLARDFFVAQSHEALEAYRAYVCPGFEAADHAFLDRLFRSRAFSFDVRDLAATFPAPALVLAGRQDSVVGHRDAWDMLGGFPRGTFAVLDLAGHALGIEQRGLFRCLTGEWLGRVQRYVETS